MMRKKIAEFNAHGLDKPEAFKEVRKILREFGELVDGIHSSGSNIEAYHLHDGNTAY